MYHVGGGRVTAVSPQKARQPEGLHMWRLLGPVPVLAIATMGAHP